MKNVCCIVNPVSGLKKSLKVYYEAKNHFEESNFNTSLFISCLLYTSDAADE